MAHEIIVKTKILQSGTERAVCIGIDNGKITAVEKHLDGDREFDLKDYLTLPGGVDVHTHMREPGSVQKEDFYTGTKAAAFGGTTTILDMPNTIPSVKNELALRDKLDIVKNRANVDFGLFGQLSDIDQIPGMANLAIGFKLYMSETTGTSGTIKTPLELLLNSDSLAGKVVTVHAEDPRMFADDVCDDLHRHNLIRNMKAEFMALRRILSIDSQVKLNLAHLTTAESIDQVKAKRASFEITPHHVLLHDASNIGTMGKVNPPLRKKVISKRLFDTLKTGRAIIASDHAPHTLEEKSVEFENAPSGLPGVETRVPLMLALAKKGMIRYIHVQDMCCTLPAELFDMKKGKIEPGYDADLAFYDMDNMVKIEPDMLHSKCGWTPFEGHDAVFPRRVMLRGQMIIHDGELAVEKSGKFLQ
ncbi:MAG: dihydroorotase [Thermoplasmata archaeon]|nr:dihydroorotase [Thermoplasmata archaeon]